MKYIKRVIASLCCALFLLVGCGSGGSAQSEGQTLGLPIAFGLPRVVALNVYMSRGLVVEAVYQATALSGGSYYGRIVNTGTLVLGPAGLQYQPSPTDRLVLKLGTQSRLEAWNTNTRVCGKKCPGEHGSSNIDSLAVLAAQASLHTPHTWPGRCGYLAQFRWESIPGKS